MKKEDLMKTLKISKQIIDRLEKPYITTSEKFRDIKLIEEMAVNDIQNDYEEPVGYIKFSNNPMEVL